MSDPFAFDQRPGALAACGECRPVQIVGTRSCDDGHDYRVLMLICAPGMIGQIALSPDDAEALAGELASYAQVCRGEHETMLRRRREQEASQ